METQNRKVNFTLIIILMISHLAFGQEEAKPSKKSDDVQWNIYKNEIGLDFKLLDRDLKLNSIGSNLIFKKRIGEKKYISKNSKKALRFQLGAHVSYLTASNDAIISELTNVLHSYGVPAEYITNNSISIRGLVGIEWQKQIKRIQLYYGLEGGISYATPPGSFSALYYIVDGVSIGVSYSEYKTKQLTLPLYGFIGAKYFIHPRISISLESSINAGVGLSNKEMTTYSNIISQGNVTIDKIKQKGGILIFNTNYLRYLNINFHF